MLIRLIVVIILQYIQILNPVYITYLLLFSCLFSYLLSSWLCESTYLSDSSGCLPQGYIRVLKRKKKIISNFPPFIHISVYLSTENQLSMQNTQFLGNLASFKEFSIKTCFSLHLFTKGGTMWYLTFSMTPVVFKHPVKQSLNS